jgi:sarcosine oxidase, subunit alpha
VCLQPETPGGHKGRPYNWNNRIKQTALFHTHRESGAAMIEHHGWQIASSFADPAHEAARARESVGLADVSWMSKLNLQGSGLKSALDLRPEASSWLLARRQFLLTCEPSAAGEVRRRLQQLQNGDATSPANIYVTDVTSAYTQLMLTGPRSREVLSKLTSLNLSEGVRANLTCAQASLAHVHAIVLRDDLPGIPAFHLLVGREYGEGVWESVLHAGREFDIRPFGLVAQGLLQK